MDPIAVFGIGSTNFRYALGTPDGEFHSEVFRKATDPPNLETQLREAIERLEEDTDAPIEHASISLAGLVDPEVGVVERMDGPNGTTTTDVRVADVLAESLGVTTTIENDGNAAAIGEYVFGAGRDVETLAHVTIGTGIGAGVVADGQVLRGASNQAGEVGHVTVDATAERAKNGVRGAWEAFCSGSGIPGYLEERLAAETRETVLEEADRSAPAFFEAVADGDPVAEAYFEEISRCNAAGLANLVNVVDPGVVTLGGGVVNNQPMVLTGIERYLEEYLVVTPPEVSRTELGGHIGLYGALALPRFRSDDTDPATPSPEGVIQE
jgi:glucokinase